MKINKINKSRLYKNSKKMSKKMSKKNSKKMTKKVSKKVSKKMTKKNSKKNKMNGGMSVNIFSKFFSSPSRSPSPSPSPSSSSTINPEVLKANSIINNKDLKNTTVLSIDSGIMKIGNKTKNLKGLDELDIVKEIVKALLLSGKSLTSLDISNNNMTDNQIVSIINNLLLININLTTLKLSGNTISIQSMKSIGDLLNKNTTLTKLQTLDISNNGIQTNHIIHLGIDLLENKTLKTLDISDNSIGVEGDTYKHLAGIYIGKIITGNNTLTDLYINNNPFTKDKSQFISIKKALENKNTITKMRFTSNNTNNTINKLLEKIKIKKNL